MALEGRLQVRSYDGNDGQRRWVTEVVVEQMEFVGSKNDSKDNSGNGNSGGGTHSGSSSSFEGLGQEVMFDDNELPF